MSKRFAQWGPSARSATHSSRHDHAVAVRDRVERRRPHAPRGRASREDHRVDALVHEQRRQVRLEEAGCELLRDHDLALVRREPRIDLDARVAELELEQRRDLLAEDARVLSIRVVGRRGEEDGNLGRASDGQEPCDRLDCGALVAADLVRRVVERDRHVDDEQRRALPEAGAGADAARAVELERLGAPALPDDLRRRVKALAELVHPLPELVARHVRSPLPLAAWRAPPP